MSARPPSLPASTPAPENSAGHPGILVADDEEGIRDVLSLALGMQGCRVWLAANGQEALATYARHGPEIDLVLLDVCLPVLDGPGTFLAMRQLHPGIKCCFMTGDPGRYAPDSLWHLGPLHVFDKPLRVVEAAELLRDLATGAVPLPARESL